jgi:purine-nucleoside/S-methyl-5'-thioadenosine phosphorylase / adenosine deaminase
VHCPLSHTSVVTVYNGTCMPPTALQHAVAKKRAQRVATNRVPTPHNWVEHHSGGLRILQVPAFAKIPWLIHGFSTGDGGVSALQEEKVLNLGFTAWDSRKNVLENRRRLQSAMNAKELALVTLKQFHSDLVVRFDANPAEPQHADAAITNHSGLLLAVQTADCIPILLVDPKKRAVAAIHAGWRGTLRRIAAKAVGHMRMDFGSKPEDLLAAIGPAIGGCCYEVGTEVAAEFLSQFADAPDFFDEFRTGDEPNPIQWLNQMPPGHQPPPKNVLLDLRKANHSQLRALGLHENNIFVSNLCTADRPDLLFSYRKQGANSGRQMAAIAIRPSL